MKVRLAKFSPFTAPGILFAAEGETGGGTTEEVTDTTSVDDTTEVDDPAAKLAAALKVNSDLERKLKRSDDNRSKVSELEQTLSDLQAKINGKEVEHAAEKAQRERDATTLAAADKKILALHVSLAAKGKLANPALALKLLELSEFEVGEDSSVDETAIAAAIDKLIEDNPGLAVQDGKRFQGGADGGTRKESSKSFDDQIAEATKAGNFQLVIALKQQRASSASKS